MYHAWNRCESSRGSAPSTSYAFRLRHWYWPRKQKSYQLAEGLSAAGEGRVGGSWRVAAPPWPNCDWSASVLSIVICPAGGRVWVGARSTSVLCASCRVSKLQSCQ